jgi:hypothetical protein
MDRARDAKVLNIDCFWLNLKKGFDKDDKLDLAHIELSFVEKYADAIKPLLEYFSSSSELIGVERVSRQGDLLRPQFRGHRKKHESVAIGLAISIVYYDVVRGIFRGRPLNIDELKKVYGYDDVVFEVAQGDLLNNASWFLDLSQVYPFSIIRVFKVLYNPSTATLQALLKAIYGKYEKALSETLKHLKVPSKPTLSMDEVEKRDVYIVVYRCQRNFVATVLTPAIIREMFATGINKLIISNTLAYLITRDEDVAYYYVATLNYLVHAVKMFKGSFILNQYGRPVEAIRVANLEWNEEEWQFKVAELARKASEKARQMTLQSLGIAKDAKLYELTDRGVDIEIKNRLGERAYEVLHMLMYSIREVDEAFRIINEKVDKNMLKEAVRKVAEGV